MTIPPSMERFNEAIDEMLEGGQFDESTVTGVQEILQEAMADGVSVVALMHLVKHPMMAQALSDGEVPTPLVGSISQALHESLDMFSEWTGAPLLIQLERLEREFRRENQTYQRVRRRLESADEQTGQALMERYLNREPSAFFSKQLKSQFPWLDKG